MKSRLAYLFYFSFLFCFSFIFYNCNGTEHTEAITAEITAAQIEGRRAARDIINQDIKDTAQLQRALLDAKVRQSKYLIEKKPECANAFDSTFISTIKIVRPDIARIIKKQ